MNSSVKQNIKVTFERIKAAFNGVELKEAKEYYVTLGNVNEIHLIKKDATKSVFLGKIFTSDSATIDEECKRIWAVIGNYFKVTKTQSTTAPVIEAKVEPVKKSTKRTKKTVEDATVEVPEVSEDFAKDDDTSWIDAIQ